MRIIEVLPDLSQGGAEQMVVSLSKQLMARGHEVEVVVLRDSANSSSHRRALSEANIPVSDIGKMRSRSPDTLFRLRRRIFELRPDVVHTHLYALHYSLLTMFSRTPRRQAPVFVHTVHNIANAEVRKRPVLGRIGYSIALRAGITPVCLSEPLAETFVERYGSLSSRMRVIPNGVDMPDLTPTTAAPAPPRNTRIAAVGRLTEQKNFDLLIRAAGHLAQQRAPHPTIDIYGDGPERDKLEASINEQGVRDVVTLRGHASGITDLLRSYDVLVLTSLYEGLPLVLLEAGAANVTPLVPDLPELMSLAAEGALPIFKAGSSPALARALRELCLDPEGRVAAADRWSARVRSAYSASQMAEKYEALFFSLVESRKSK